MSTTANKTWALIPNGVLAEGRKIHRRFALLPSPPQDEPRKRYLLDGPSLNIDLPTFKKLQALNEVLRLRKAEVECETLGEKERMWAEAMRRLPM